MSDPALKGVQAICFDAGQTLMEVHPSVGKIYQRVLGELGIQITDTDSIDADFFAVLKARTAKRPDLRSSEAIERDFWQAIVDDLVGEHFRDGRVPEAVFARLWSAFESAECWRPLEGAPEVFEQLRSAGLRLALLSNWDERLHPLFGQLGWKTHFDYLGISSEIGWSKPAPEAFRAVAQALDLPLDAICHVGDSLDSDVRGAQAAGFQALWYRPGATGQADGVPSIASLLELPKCIRG